MESKLQDSASLLDQFQKLYDDQRTGGVTPENCVRYWNDGRIPWDSSHGYRSSVQKYPEDICEVLGYRQGGMKRFCERRGKRYEACSFENFEIVTNESKAAVEKLTRWTSSFPFPINRGENLILFGTVGTGKDHLLVAAAKRAFMFGYFVNCISGAAMFAELRKSFSNETNTSEHDLVRTFSEAEILAISDPLPPSDLTDYQRSTLYRIFDERYSNQLPTWVTVNVPDRETLYSRIGEATGDRLVDDALAIAFDWESYRRPKSNGQ